MANIHTITPGPTHPDGLLLGEAATEKIGFHGKAPVAQRANAAQAAASDPATTMALANEIRTVLVNLGLMKGSA